MALDGTKLSIYFEKNMNIGTSILEIRKKTKKVSKGQKRNKQRLGNVRQEIKMETDTTFSEGFKTPESGPLAKQMTIEEMKSDIANVFHLVCLIGA